ncbi:MAG: dicarboxylate/amino acid:cation symporter [Bdellovibrionales bacterium]|nr:dicarboxylate/amino acid:cation symporter [Bdellovibrionales bacterium]
MKTHYKLLLGLFLGALLGTLLHPYAASPWVSGLATYVMDPLGQVFLRLIFMIVVPMVLAGLILGVYQLGRHHGLGKVVQKTLLYTLIASTASVVIGVTLVSLVRPGKLVTMQSDVAGSAAAAVERLQGQAQAAKPVVQALLDIIPKNPLDAAVRALDGEMLALMFFALLFGFALSRVRGGGKMGPSGLIPIFEEVFDGCLKIVEYAMRLAPYAVFALMFMSTLRFGHELLLSLAAYVAVVLVGLAIQQFVVYGAMLKFIGGEKPLSFFHRCRDVYVYAFATASSNATLPKSLELAEHGLKIPAPVSRFVLTVGSTANQNGTALFEGITVLFLAQLYGVDLSVGQQFQVVLMSILAGVGTAGVPGGSLPLIMILLQQVGIPPEGMGVILGVDRLLDMSRTAINVSGDLVIARLVGGEVKVRA